MRRRLPVAAVVATALGLGACGERQVDRRAVLDGYRAVAHASFEAALADALRLQASIARLDTTPGPDSLQAARRAWRAARVSYSQTEALRFGHWFIDDWEHKVNSWPIDEGFLDYVQRPYDASPSNPLARANLIRGGDWVVGGRPLSTEPINHLLLERVQQQSDFEANVATGYHAIEFLLWGQDLNPSGPGARPWTDFARDATRCTDGPALAPLRHCQRRRDFLVAATELLVLNLRAITPVWGPQAGSYGDRLVQGDLDQGLRRVLFGLASFGADELAGERMEVGLIAGAQEEEQDCFSDDTHHSLYYNARGIANFYFGRFGDLKVPVSLADLARATDPALAQEIADAVAASEAALAKIRDAGRSGQTVDRLIAPGNTAGKSTNVKTLVLHGWGGDDSAESFRGPRPPSLPPDRPRNYPEWLVGRGRGVARPAENPGEGRNGPQAGPGLALGECLPPTRCEQMATTAENRLSC